MSARRITDTLARLSVGIEDIRDLQADVERALAALPGVGRYGPILIVQPLARQRADTLENTLLDKQAKDLWQGVERRAAAAG